MVSIPPLHPDLGPPLLNGVAILSQLAQDFPSLALKAPSQTQVNGVGFVLVPRVQFLTTSCRGRWRHRTGDRCVGGWSTCLLSQVGGNTTQTPFRQRVLPLARVRQKTASSRPSRQGTPVSGNRPSLEKRELPCPQACCSPFLAPEKANHG